ncbi:MAG TPA: hypothetical protein VMV18_04545 [bacterium]|nr:hypothetical protein [bacterium]
MRRLSSSVLPVVLFAAALGACAPHSAPPAAAKPPASGRRYLKGTVDGAALCQLYVDDWEALTPSEHVYAYFLSQAALAMRDVYWDQMHRDSLALRGLLEGIVTRPGATDAATLAKIHLTLDTLYVDSSPYDGHTLQKHAPAFTRAELLAAAKAAHAAGASFAAPPLLMEQATPEAAVARVAPLLFDAAVDPVLTARAPRDGKDIVQASGVNFYRGVTLAEVEAFKPKFDLNSTIVKNADGRIEEQVWRTGDMVPQGGRAAADAIPAGLYAVPMTGSIRWLAQATSLATPEQAKVLLALANYYRTGAYADFKAYSVAWLQGAPKVDLVMGFIEDYHDPRAQKGSYEGMVYVPAPELSRRMKAIADHVLYLESKEPWKDEYKKTEIHPPVAQAIQAIVETGDFAGRSSPVGINLPNPQEIRQQYGAKSVYLVNVDLAAQAVATEATATEFALPEDREEILKYAGHAWELIVALHEIAGHASGKVSPTLTEDPAKYIREYYSALEEARADLVALWNLGDPELIKAGVIDGPDVRRSAYKQYVMRALAQLRRAPKGEVYGEDHLRAIALVVEYARAKGAVERVERGGKHYERLVDEEKFRLACGELLAELMRIKATGDYDAAKAIVEKYGVHFDPALRDEVVARAKSAGVPSAFRFLSPRIDPVKDASGTVVDAKLSYDESLEEQELRYSGRR